MELTAQIQVIYTDHKMRYGSPRVHQHLRQKGIFVGRKRVERIMREHGLAGRTRCRFVRTTVVDPQMEPAPNLLARNFKADVPNCKWVTDITYVDTDEGWLYLAAIQDLFSGRIVGWAMADSLHTQLCLEALNMAVTARRPPVGLIHHSDRGCQYTSEHYRQVIKNYGMCCSMSRRGQCWDNAPAESLFGRLKEELFPRKRWSTRAQATEAISAYIETYFNPARSKKRLGYRSPIDYEIEHAMKQRAS